jgi:hypothetical protein
MEMAKYIAAVGFGSFEYAEMPLTKTAAQESLMELPSCVEL